MKKYLLKMFSTDSTVSSTRILAALIVVAAIIYLFIALYLDKTEHSAGILSAMLIPAFGGRGVQSIGEYFGGKNIGSDS